MKTYLLPKEGNFYKANLHCHSTISDGRWTPEEIKENYKAHGYSIVAYTDHQVFITHNDLRDAEFLPLNGYELDFTEPKREDGKTSKTCHLCFVSLDEDKKLQKIFYETKILARNMENACLDPGREPLQRQYDPAYISDIIKEGVEDGFFVTYNHPVWSLESKDQYCNYHGMHAMEILNYGCVVEGYDDHNGAIYDEMLRNGERLYCVATDDNHNRYPINHPQNHSFGGFTVIKAEKLTYADIAKALVDGHFYASEGPEIKELYFEDNKVYIECSEAARIVMAADNRRYKCVTAEKNGETVNCACFEIDEKLGDYVRFTVIDEKGREANTNAYFLSDLPLEAPSLEA